MRQGIYLADDDYIREYHNPAGECLFIRVLGLAEYRYWLVEEEGIEDFKYSPRGVLWDKENGDFKNPELHRLLLPIEFMETKGD